MAHVVQSTADPVVVVLDGSTALGSAVDMLTTPVSAVDQAIAMPDVAVDGAGTAAEPVGAAVQGLSETQGTGLPIGGVEPVGGLTSPAAAATSADDSTLGTESGPIGSPMPEAIFDPGNRGGARPVRPTPADHGGGGSGDRARVHAGGLRHGARDLCRERAAHVHEHEADSVHGRGHGSPVRRRCRRGGLGRLDEPLRDERALGTRLGRRGERRRSMRFATGSAASCATCRWRRATSATAASWRRSVWCSVSSTSPS